MKNPEQPKTIEKQEKWDIKGSEMPREEFEKMYQRVWEEEGWKDEDNPVGFIGAVMQEEYSYRVGGGEYTHRISEISVGRSKKELDWENYVVNHGLHGNGVGPITVFLWLMMENNKGERKEILDNMEGVNAEEEKYKKFFVDNKTFFEKSLDIELFKLAVEKVIEKKSAFSDEKQREEALKLFQKDGVLLYESIRRRVLPEILKKYGGEK